MKRLKIFGYIIGAGIALIVIAFGLALSSGVQTWAVRKAAAGQKDVKMEVTRVDAGLSGAAVSDLRFEKDGIVVTAKGVSAKYSAWDYLRNRQLNAEDVSVDELVIDLRNAKQPSSGPAPAGATTVTPTAAPSSPQVPAAKPAPFDGLLKQLQLPVDGRVGTLNVKGRALLPDNRTVTFEFKGSRIEAGQNGKLEWTVEFADSCGLRRSWPSGCATRRQGRCSGLGRPMRWHGSCSFAGGRSGSVWPLWDSQRCRSAGCGPNGGRPLATSRAGRRFGTLPDCRCCWCRLWRGRAGSVSLGDRLDVDASADLEA